MTLSIVAISVGGSLGALLRWFLGTKLNALFTLIPPGTLTFNLIGGYLVGIAVAYFSTHPSLPPEWRLLIVTGFLGGLTTFSTFSAEVVAQLMAERMMWALSGVAVHVAGSLLMTLLGIGTVALLRTLNSQDDEPCKGSRSRYSPKRAGITAASRCMSD